QTPAVATAYLVARRGARLDPVDVVEAMSTLQVDVSLGESPGFGPHVGVGARLEGKRRPRCVAHGEVPDTQDLVLGHLLDPAAALTNAPRPAGHRDETVRGVCEIDVTAKRRCPRAPGDRHERGAASRHQATAVP